MEIDYINGSFTKKIYGMSRYEIEINKRIHQTTFNRIEYHPLMARLEDSYHEDEGQQKNPQPQRIPTKLIDLGRDMVRGIDQYRYIKTVKKMVKPGNIKHITFQDLAYIQKSLQMDRTIINCHDLIPWAYEHNRTATWKNNINGLKKADKIITVSDFSKNEITHYLDYDPLDVHVIPDAVDHTRYHPQLDGTRVLKNAGIDEDHKFILYLGSETPRMNLELILKAMAKLKKLLPQVKLLKIGDPQSYQGRKNTIELMDKLNLSGDVILMGYVPEEDLPYWYSAVDVLVYPCLYAGFGLPPLEAMACGTPVITSNTSSIPEVMGDGGLMVDPYNPDELMVKLYEVLTMEDLNKKLIRKGLERAKSFKWDDSAKKTQRVYEELQKS